MDSIGLWPDFTWPQDGGSEVYQVETADGPRWVLRRLRLMATAYWHVAEGRWVEESLAARMMSYWATITPTAEELAGKRPPTPEQSPEYWFPSWEAAEALRETADTWHALAGQ